MTITMPNYPDRSLKNTVSMLAGVTVLTLLTFTLAGRAQATTYAFNNALSAAQEVPPNPSTALGQIMGTYDDVTKVFDFSLSFVGLLGPTTAAHLHAPGPPGVNAPVVIAFAGFPIGVFSGGYANTYVFTPANETDLLSGLMYVNVHTNLFPGGEIRAQILAVPQPIATPTPGATTTYTFDNVLSAAQEVPPNPSTALGQIMGTYDSVTKVFDFSLSFVGLLGPTTAAHLHAPAPPGVNGPIVIGFAGFPVGVFSGGYANTYIFTPANETDLLSGLMYVNVHTNLFPGGEIRAQILAVPQPPAAPTPTPTPTPTATPTSTPPPPHATPTPRPHATPTPRPPHATPTPSPHVTPTPRPPHATPTPTPMQPKN